MYKRRAVFFRRSARCGSGRLKTEGRGVLSRSSLYRATPFFLVYALDD